MLLAKIQEVRKVKNVGHGNQHSNFPKDPKSEISVGTDWAQFGHKLGTEKLSSEMMTRSHMTLGLNWCARRESNPRPSASETDTLSS